MIDILTEQLRSYEVWGTVCEIKQGNKLDKQKPYRKSD